MLGTCFRNPKPLWIVLTFRRAGVIRLSIAEGLFRAFEGKWLTVHPNREISVVVHESFCMVSFLNSHETSFTE